MANQSPSPSDQSTANSLAGQQDEVLEEEEAMEDDSDDPHGGFGFFRAMPSWAVSMMVHVVILLVLGLISVADPVKIVNVLTASSTSDDGPEIEEFTIDQTDPGEMETTDEVTEPTPDLAEPMEIVEPTEVEPMEMSDIAVDMSQMAADLAPQPAALKTLTQVTMQPLSARSDKTKQKMLREYGGTPSSEAAVTMALKWFSRHQMPNGGWTFQHNLVCNGACGNPGEESHAKSVNAATALAILPFLGAGQTHKEGDYRQNVFRGLRFLVQNGKPGMKAGMPVLDLSEDAGNMYSHGLATIALCEAYAMTEDKELYGPAQAAINFVVYAQCKDGGWRYKPQDGRGGDISVAGWQIMALKSGHMGHLKIPPITVNGITLFLDKVSSDGGARYGYDKPSTYSHTRNSVGLLCRMYMGWDKSHPGIQKGAASLAKRGVDKGNVYHDYYAAQVLRQFGGENWDKFNVSMRDWLVETQDQEAGAKGSWYFPGKRLNHVEAKGGRLATTSFATMMLEVYYRHMPLYDDKAAEEDFPL